MRYGLSRAGRAQRFKGRTMPYHIARERDLQEYDNRCRLFIRGLCGVPISSFYRDGGSYEFPPRPLCKRCREMNSA